jgi:hypothetical protein
MVRAARHRGANPAAAWRTVWIFSLRRESTNIAYSIYHFTGNVAVGLG